MNTKIQTIYPGSIAEELELEPGDILLTINKNNVKDIIDYKFLMAEEFIEIEVKKPNGDVWDFEIDKDYEEDLGVDFDNSIMDSAKSCCNKCIFCFIDQLPDGMRDTLYFKDDDSRLSFLQGNFVTLTNMNDEDIDRIIRYRISPINISVHTTNPEIRVKMLNNKFAANLYERLKKLAAAGISMNCQIVSCPDINNGAELVRTVEDLFLLYPSVQNVAVVPVGITKYRENLIQLKLYDKTSSRREIDEIAKLQSKYISDTGHPFVRLSDEFYITAKAEIPASDFYGDFEQIEDGVGMIRLFRESIKKNIKYLNNHKQGSFTFITGESAYDEITAATLKIKAKNQNIKVNVIKIINEYFGETITVAGLITGKDILSQLKSFSINDNIIIPQNMLKGNELLFLDNVSVADLKESFNKNILICHHSGEDLIHIINDNLKEENKCQNK